MLVESGHSVDIACNLTQKLNPELLELVRTVYNIPFNRSPLKRGNIEAYQNLKIISKEVSYDIVHTHTPVASTLTRIIFKKSNSRVIYTAHGFHFYKGAPLINWLIYYPIEWWLARHTDIIITINKADYNRAKKSFRAGKIEYIPGVGINLNMFDHLNKENKLERSDFGIPSDAKLILSVGELNENKNHEVVIKALGILKDENVHYAICGEGSLRGKLEKTILKHGLAKQVHLLGFRNDVKDIYLLADLFIFPSKREGLPVALLEALLSGLPVIASNIRGNTDLANLKLPIKLIDTLTPIVLADEIKLWLNAANISKNYSSIKEALSSFGSHNIEKQLIKIYFASD